MENTNARGLFNPKAGAPETPAEQPESEMTPEMEASTPNVAPETPILEDPEGAEEGTNEEGDGNAQEETQEVAGDNAPQEAAAEDAAGDTGEDAEGGKDE